MSATLEQTRDEIAFLIGAKITDVTLGEVLILHVETPTTVVDGDTSGNKVEVEVWRDTEGNGPGYLALTNIIGGGDGQ